MRMADLRVEVPLADDAEFNEDYNSSSTAFSLPGGGDPMVPPAGTTTTAGGLAGGSTPASLVVDTLNNNTAGMVDLASIHPDSGICSETESIIGSSYEKDSAAFINILKESRNTEMDRQNDNLGGGDADFSEVEGLGGSLEDLVNCFDGQISKCLKNYTENTEKLAPVQVRTQEEIMDECQIWWTLTGNFGNILPIDWSKSYSRKLHLPSLNLKDNSETGDGSVDDNSRRSSAAVDSQASPADADGRTRRPPQDQSPGVAAPVGPDVWRKNLLPTDLYRDGDAALHLDSDEDDDDELAQALDMHSMIMAPHDLPPPQTAEQVIQEIDEIMQQTSSAETTGRNINGAIHRADAAFLSPLKPHQNNIPSEDPEVVAKVREAQALTCSDEKLKALPRQKLHKLQDELESLIQVYNESLVAELALRDELEYEKELKNTFISVLLNIQNKRRQYVTGRKASLSSGSRLSLASATTSPNGNSVAEAGANGTHPQFLTAVIPYDEESGPPDNARLQALIKILRAVNDDKPEVPNLLTDYILNVLCPSGSPRPSFLAI